MVVRTSLLVSQRAHRSSLRVWANSPRSASAACYRKAADQGYPFAENNLAMMYETGKGVMRDYAEALKLFGEGAAKGNGFSQYKLGRMYERGLGVKKDLVEAYRWYLLAAQHQDEHASESLKRLDPLLSQAQKDDAHMRAAAGKGQGHD